jgi:hypothetical protein
MHGVITPPAVAGQLLADLAQQIQAEHQAAVAALRTSAERAMAAGDLLIKAKGHVPHGQWAEWVERNCKMSYRAARTYMQLAQDREAVESKMAELGQFDLSIAGALKLISGPPRARNTLPAVTAPPLQPDRLKAGATYKDVVEVWDRLPPAARIKFFDAIGLSAILDNIPDKWRRDVEVRLSNWDYPPPVWRKINPNAAEPAAGDGDDLLVPTFLRREPAEVQ